MSTSEYSNAPQTPGAPAPEAGVDADAVARAKREIQATVQQISEMSRSDLSPDRYYDEFLNRVVAALAAVGGAVWTLSDERGLQLSYQINLRQTGLAENPIAQSQHARLLHRVLTAEVDSDGGGAIVTPHSGFSASGEVVSAESDEQAPANATDYLLILAPVHNDQGAQGVVEVFQRPGARPQVQRGYLRFLQQTCQLAGDYLRSRRLSHLTEKQSLWEQLETFTRAAHEGLDVRQASYTIANEGRRLVGADRVTVAVGRGGRPKIEAVSGMDAPDDRSNVSTLLTKVARAVAKTGEDVWYTGDTSDMAPQVERAIDAYVDESHAKAMAILPLVDRRGKTDDDHEPDEPAPKDDVLGVLIVEQMVDNQIPDGYAQRVDVVRTHSSTALANALEHEGLFLMPLWKMLGKATWMFRRRTLPKTVGVLTLVIGLTLAALFMQKDLLLEGDGKLRPQELRYVFAQVEGKVKRVLVDHEQAVAEGEPLVELESIDLEKELANTRGELDELFAEQRTLRAETLSGVERVTPAERRGKEARLTKLEKEISSLQKQLSLLETKNEQLTVRSPINGEVITFKVEEQLLGRPVRGDQVLMEIANPAGDWILEVEMPEKRMGHITKAIKEADGALPVTFFLATNTEEKLTGELLAENVSATAEVRGEQGTTVLLKVVFDQDEFEQKILDPKVGAEVRARVAAGRCSYAYAYLHDLIDFLRAKVFFRLW